MRLFTNQALSSFIASVEEDRVKAAEQGVGGVHLQTMLLQWMVTKVLYLVWDGAPQPRSLQRLTREFRCAEYGMSA